MFALKAVRILQTKENFFWTTMADPEPSLFLTGVCNQGTFWLAQKPVPVPTVT